MEKDWFKDRSPQCTSRKDIKQGSVMYICQKHQQKQIKSDDLSKLDKIICVTHLSKKQFHPRRPKSEGV